MALVGYVNKLADAKGGRKNFAKKGPIIMVLWFLSSAKTQWDGPSPQPTKLWQLNYYCQDVGPFLEEYRFETIIRESNCLVTHMVPGPTWAPNLS